MAKEFYKWIRLGGLLSFIPFVLAAGPLAGFFVGNYLIHRFDLPYIVVIICIGVGFLGSVRETIRIIRIALKSSRET